MKEIKIQGFKVLCLDDNIKILDSYKIKDINKMKNIIIKILKKNNLYTSEQNINSFLNKWIAYNFLYRIPLFKKYTKNCIFNNKQNKITNFIYSIISFILKRKYNKKINKINKKINKQNNKYIEYIEEHRANVMNAYHELTNNPKFFQKYNDEIINGLYERAIKHDLSKYSNEEFDGYRKYFYPISIQEKEQNIKNFNKAWEHHWKHNSHHWQYRQNKKIFNKNNKEEILDILENILDWMAMGYKFNNRPYQYYLQNKDKILLCNEEKEYLENLIFNIIDVDYINKEDLNNESRE